MAIEGVDYNRWEEDLGLGKKDHPDVDACRLEAAIIVDKMRSGNLYQVGNTNGTVQRRRSLFQVFLLKASGKTLTEDELKMIREAGL